jgi:acetyl/propionyl-CoA carboxylase alpha subunit
MIGPKVIKRVLIANRGEIARRIIRTCAQRGIETVAIYTEVDSHAPHVSEATSAHPLGTPDSYLSSQKIIAAAQASGADSVHPGYGFLSENPEFAEAVRSAGLTWIGPTPETIRKLGSKTAAKELAAQANVPVSPTLLLPLGTPEQQALEISSFGSKVGFPLILKAAAGGGGRGMRFINAESDMIQELASARRESLAAFGSDEVFVEKCITPARHIEVQIAGDTQGNVIALGTRDCSLQRSNQKIIEEAPATKLAPGAEECLLNAAAALGKAAGYTNLGTVEFLYGLDGSAYFLEVNTRLQVEHPVTELVTKLDLVELQLRLASGESLSACGIASTPKPQGHAIEARWCAEEYTDRFTTATGVVLDISVPDPTQRGAKVRVDRGVELCSMVSHYYDSLIGKVIVHAHDRGQAIEALDEVLSRSRLSGVKTNRSLLLHLLRTKEFKALTHTVQGTRALLPSLDTVTRAVEHAHTVAAALRCATPHSSWVQDGPWLSSIGPNSLLSYQWSTTEHDKKLVSSTRLVDGAFEVTLPSGTRRVAILEGPFPSGSLVTATVSVDGGPELHIATYRDANDLWVHTPHGSCLLHQPGVGESQAASPVPGAHEIRSTIPGKVAAISVNAGDYVEHGDPLLVLDSMKMEHPIRATMNGTVVSIPVQVGSIVQSGSILVVLSSEG